MRPLIFHSFLKVINDIYLDIKYEVVIMFSIINSRVIILCEHFAFKKRKLLNISIINGQYDLSEKHYMNKAYNKRRVYIS